MDAAGDVGSATFERRASVRFDTYGQACIMPPPYSLPKNTMNLFAKSAKKQLKPSLSWEG